jgi:site-specific DNA-methyltransferase (adenine-specific)
MIDLRQGDCLEVMKDIPDKSIDMILCDLPYGVTRNKKDKVIPFNNLWEQYTRIIRDNGAIILFGQGLFFIDLVNSNRKLFRYDLIWDKVLTSGFLNAKRMPLRQHEQIAVFYKKLPVYNPQFSKGKPLHGRGISYLTKEHKNNNYGEFKQLNDVRKGNTDKYPTSILKYSKVHPSKTIHPTEKVIELLEYLIKTYTNENDIVLDNCAGSMSTAIACLNTNRKGIMIEKDKEYFNIGCERIKRHILDNRIDLLREKLLEVKKELK